MSGAIVHTGDCLQVMPTMPADHFDAIVTDPPYGLEFMGKAWDAPWKGDTRQPGDADFHKGSGPFSRATVRYGGAGYGGKAATMRAFQAWFEPIAAEMLRVAKPGAYALVFGGTRTYHRTTAAMEDAGWEIRDCIMYAYGSGFPKSHNFGCKCRGDALPYNHEQEAKSSSECDVRSVRSEDLPQAVHHEEEQGQVLLASVPKQGAQEHGTAGAKSKTARTKQPGVEGRGNVLAEARQLQADQVRAVPGGVYSHGPEGRIRDGASPDNGENRGAMPGANGSGASQEPRPTGQQAGEPGAIRQQRRAQAGRVAPDKVCPKCGGLIEWAGWGTALKPAYEPIIVARKPLAGTVAANVLQYGTGALNIDGCRVGTETIISHGGLGNNAVLNDDGWKGIGAPRKPTVAVGRWPANLIHDGSDEVMAAFPQAPGQQGDLDQQDHAVPPGAAFGAYGPKVAHAKRLDTGSAARFFYCAKASRADREDGCHGFTPTTTDDGRQVAADNAYQRGKTERKNNHPTVKPTDLMRYLCRLVTPPGGNVLDPFTGSGSTGRGAVLEGFDFVGIEREADFQAIATARIAAAARQAAASGAKQLALAI